MSKVPPVYCTRCGWTSACRGECVPPERAILQDLIAELRANRLGVSLSLLEKHARTCLPLRFQRILQQERTYRDAPR